MAGTTTRKNSSLQLDKEGKLKLRLIQAATGSDLVGKRLALAFAQELKEPTPEEVAACRTLLEGSREKPLTVMSYHPGLTHCRDLVEELGAGSTIIALPGVVDDPLRHNRSWIVAKKLHDPAKISLSTDDEQLKVQPGNELILFADRSPAMPDAVKWAVLNCHEYSHVDIVNQIQKEKLEVLIVVTYNTATRLFWQYAIADVHRQFCYVIVANVAELGGSGVFAPFRRIGLERNAELGAGGQVFGSKGTAELEVFIDLEIGELRRLREEFARHGFRAAAVVEARQSIYTPMVPSEHFMDTFDRGPGEPECEVTDIPTEWNCADPRVAIAQLESMNYAAYYETRYRLRKDPRCGEFEELLQFRLRELELRCQGKERTSSGALLDFLLLPEVFVPRSFLPALQDFSDRMQCIVIAGVDYPDTEDANECMILQPCRESVTYRKVTRSQYDAKTDGKDGRFPMLRGTKLFRFVSQEGRGFGVLICYDFSHFDLMWKLNLERRTTPLDAIFIVAHNPFGDLYRSCCIADSHRFYQYIVMCNVSTFGGSGIFAPIRTEGARQVLLDAGKGVETIAMGQLRLAKLQESRDARDQDLHEKRFMRRPGVFQRRWP